MRRPVLILALCFATGILQAAEPRLDDSNSWPFPLRADPFSSHAKLDLRYLNEAKSGQSGFIRQSADGNDFVLGNGEPVRFWAVGTDVYKNVHSPQVMDTHCRWLAKLGVNLVRLHVTICSTREGSTMNDLNREVIDGCYRLIKAAKDNGIYVLISPYYPHFEVPVSWGLEGGKQQAAGALFVDPDLQEAYKSWTRTFYTSENPHTGLAIKDDPTVAILQVQNEDSLFFWTQAQMADVQKKRLAVHFGAWLMEKYDSVSAAMTAWGEGAKAHPHDDPDAREAGVHDIWFLTQEHTGGMERRMRDQTQFMAEYQREFYANMGSFLRDELGCQQLLNASNWRTANDAKLKALERHSYHALDIDAENEYVGSDYQHKGENDHYRIDPGHYLVNESVLPKPFEMCTNWVQEEGHPFIVTETAWKNPNRYQSEGPFLVAGYQSLNGVDAVCWFSCQTSRWELDPLKPFWPVGNQHAMHKWNICYPAMMAGFPANAFLYRKEFLKRGEVVVRERRELAELWDRKPPRLQDNETYGDRRNSPELQPGWAPQGDEINRVAFLIGTARAELDSDGPDEVVGFDPHFDPSKGSIQSVTGELTWNYRDELCFMDAPKAQGITGFLARNGGKFELSDVTIQSTNEYATINLVALDEQPIAESAKVLVQVVTVNRLTGYESEDATFEMGKGQGSYEVEGERIVRLGRSPFRVANTEVTVAVANPGLTHATTLDINGYAIETVEIENGTFVLPTNCTYAILHPAETEEAAE